MFDGVFPVTRAENFERTTFLCRSDVGLLESGIVIADITPTECGARLHVLKNCYVLYCFTVII